MADEVDATGKIAANLREAADYLDGQPGLIRLTFAEWLVREGHQTLALLLLPPNRHILVEQSDA